VQKLIFVSNFPYKIRFIYSSSCIRTLNWRFSTALRLDMAKHSGLDLLHSANFIIYDVDATVNLKVLNTTSVLVDAVSQGRPYLT